MSDKVCIYCHGKGWRWARAAPSLGQKGYAIKKPCGYCPAGAAKRKRDKAV